MYVKDIRQVESQLETYIMAEETLEEVRLLGGDVVSTLDFLPLVSDCCGSVVRHDNYARKFQ